jgi:hypothetical protein
MVHDHAVITATQTLLCEGANRWSRDTERNTCAVSYVTADKSRPVLYLILKVIYKYINERIKTGLSKNVYFIPEIKFYIIQTITQTCNNFPNFTDFQQPAMAKPKEMDQNILLVKYFS